MILPIYSCILLNRQQFTKIDETSNAFYNFGVVPHLLRW
jgi:hypothetical protein